MCAKKMLLYCRCSPTVSKPTKGQSLHKREKWSCHICNKQFTSNSALQYHKGTHKPAAKRRLSGSAMLHSPTSKS